jgi:intracellular septation protein A
MTAVLIMSVIVYICMIFFIRYRTAIAIVGSGAILLYGSITNVFPADEAFRKFPVEIEY